jgi:D-glycero-alpha-D-manno-heptose-7-phosphate kinase
MPTTLRQLLESESIETSAPCRLDMGGTLDLATFYYPLRHLNPCTVNLALDLRTTVRLLPYRKGRIKISSTGFESAVFAADQASFRHPMGLMFAVAAHFQADGVHVVIDSQSPPRSALGGSSVAAVALVAAFSEAMTKSGIGRGMQRNQVALLAHALEESVASVPCGRQDQLAAAFGGIHLWYWLDCTQWPGFRRRRLVQKKDRERLERQLLVAYGGLPHESQDINGQWVQQFLTGEHRKIWAEVIHCTRNFAEALFSGKIRQAAEYMNREAQLRRRMTPAVVNDVGGRLIEAAIAKNCGARFTGAGGGGCIWALGLEDDIAALRETWTDVLADQPQAGLLNARLDFQGLIHHSRGLG